MALFDDVFNKAIIYEMLFFNVKSVLIYPTLEELQAKNKPLFERWEYLLKTKYNNIPAGQFVDMAEYSQKKYEENAPYYPEYSRIVAITYATLYAENGTLKRFFKKIVNEDEYVVLATFFDVLYELSSAGSKSNPQFFSIFCGHNIVSYDIPMLIKRFLLHRDKFEVNKQLPYILKRCLNVKPWESGIIDTANVWKFNGYDNMSLMLIADYLGLKKTVELEPLPEVSKRYWNIIAENTEKSSQEALEFVALQSATQTNLVIQLMNELRQL